MFLYGNHIRKEQIYIRPPCWPEFVINFVPDIARGTCTSIEDEQVNCISWSPTGWRCMGILFARVRRPCSPLGSIRTGNAASTNLSSMKWFPSQLQGSYLTILWDCTQRTARLLLETFQSWYIPLNGIMHCNGIAYPARICLHWACFSSYFQQAKVYLEPPSSPVEHQFHSTYSPCLHTWLQDIWTGKYSIIFIFSCIFAFCFVFHVSAVFSYMIPYMLTVDPSCEFAALIFWKSWNFLKCWPKGFKTSCKSRLDHFYFVNNLSY